MIFLFPLYKEKSSQPLIMFIESKYSKLSSKTHYESLILDCTHLVCCCCCVCASCWCCECCCSLDNSLSLSLNNIKIIRLEKKKRIKRLTPITFKQHKNEKASHKKINKDFVTFVLVRMFVYDLFAFARQAIFLVLSKNESFIYVIM